MSDKGKTAAIEKLRNEVGFGCPVCRSPFLTWHHFDPPEHVEKHWRPEGMIALCLEHHPNADPEGFGGNAYSPDELRAMKKKGYSSEDVRGNFISWQKNNVLVRMGSCYATPPATVLSVNGIPQISLRRNEVGLLALSFQLRNEEDAVLVEMVDNWFTAYPSNIHDMTVMPKTREMKVWLGKEDVGLELSFRRIPMEALTEMLIADNGRANTVAKERIRQQHEGMLPEDLSELLAMFDSAPDAGLVGVQVKNWVKDNCQMDDGLVPLLNFEQMAIYFHGHRLIIKNGMTNLIHYCFAENCATSYNLNCPCPRCTEAVPPARS
jgi:hypothetical protein